MLCLRRKQSATDAACVGHTGRMARDNSRLDEAVGCRAVGTKHDVPEFGKCAGQLFLLLSNIPYRCAQSLLLQRVVAIFRLNLLIFNARKVLLAAVVELEKRHAELACPFFNFQGPATEEQNRMWLSAILWPCVP